MRSYASTPNSRTGLSPHRTAQQVRTSANHSLSGLERIAVATGIGLAHGLAFWWLMNAQHRPEVVAQEVVTLVFIAPEPTSAPPAEPASQALPAATKPRTAVPPTVPERDIRPASAPGQDLLAQENDAPVLTSSPDAGSNKAAIELYDADGSFALPKDVVDRLKAVEEGSLSFAFEQPGLVRSDDFMRRPPPLEYRATQFDKYWRPERDLLTELLERAVAAMSDEVEIQVAGGAKLLCKVSLLAMGGSCQMAGGRKPVVLDDPTTLSPEEDARCAAWWDRIASPGSQAEWRTTRSLYDFHCLKPLERNLEPPERAGQQTGMMAD